MPIVRLFAAVTAIAVVIGACTGAPSVSPSASAVGGVPLAFIEYPPSGSSVVVGQALQIGARGQDTAGVNRLDLRVGDVLVDSATTPGDVAEPTFSAILEWTPSAEGTVTISVLAYRASGTGSLPATIQVAVGSTAVASPSPAPFPSAPPAGSLPPFPTSGPGTSPTAQPTHAPRPTAPPAPPTREPTAPPPIATEVEIARLVSVPEGDWIVGEPVTLEVRVRNNTDDPTPPGTVIEASAAGGTDTRRVRNPVLRPGGVEDYEVTITPERAGDRNLRVRIVLPPGYTDTAPDNNVLRMDIVVANPEPEPSPTPEATSTP